MRWFIGLWMVFVVAMSNPVRAQQWDRTFGTQGMTVVPWAGTGEEPVGFERLADGRFAILGRTQSLRGDDPAVLTLFNSNGNIDTSFGTGGSITVPLTSLSDGLGTDASGRLLVAGGNASHVMELHRILPNGVHDSSFGAGGIATFDFGPDYDAAEEVRALADGRIVVVGHSGAGFHIDLTIACFSASGELEWKHRESLSSSSAYSNDAEAFDVVEQADGKILVAGNANERATNTAPSTAAFTLIRYNSDGSRDSSFGNNGQVSTTPPRVISQNGFQKLKLLPDGKILAAGGSAPMLLAEFNPDGTPVQSFGQGGVSDPSTTSFDYYPDVKILSDGTIRVVAVGGQTVFEGMYDANGQTILNRYESAFPLPRAGWSYFVLERGLIQDDGEIIVTGSASTVSWTNNPNWAFGTDEFISRIHLTPVPEPAGAMVMLLGVVGITSRRVSARAHRRGRRSDVSWPFPGLIFGRCRRGLWGR